MFCFDVIAAAASDSMDWRAVQESRSQESIDKVQIFVKLREREGQRVNSGSRLSIVNCRLSIIDIDFPEALH